jgi:hypothetical protein
MVRSLPWVGPGWRACLTAARQAGLLPDLVKIMNFLFTNQQSKKQQTTIFDLQKA